MELTIRVGLKELLLTRKAAEISTCMGEYESRILIRHENKTVNAKSLMGLISLGVCEGKPLTIVAEGADEARAVHRLAELLGA